MSKIIRKLAGLSIGSPLGFVAAFAMIFVIVGVIEETSYRIDVYEYRNNGTYFGESIDPEVGRILLMPRGAAREAAADALAEKLYADLDQIVAELDRLRAEEAANKKGLR